MFTLNELEAKVRERYAAYQDVITYIDLFMGPWQSAWGKPENEKELNELRQSWLEFMLRLEGESLERYVQLMPTAIARMERTKELPYDLGELERVARERFSGRPHMLEFIDFLMKPMHPALGQPMNEAELQYVRRGHLIRFLATPDDLIEEEERMLPAILQSVRQLMAMATGSKC